jgi:hypothetical protein
MKQPPFPERSGSLPSSFQKKKKMEGGCFARREGEKKWAAYEVGWAYFHIYIFISLFIVNYFIIY